ncbi:MAG TPA: hypothetical protein VNG90_05685, partial [Candidatus Acidoferrum sp.]|nr:hypothetical protein [Candidatus Acidoferrum sp.]
MIGKVTVLASNDPFDLKLSREIREVLSADAGLSIGASAIDPDSPRTALFDTWHKADRVIIGFSAELNTWLTTHRDHFQWVLGILGPGAITRFLVVEFRAIHMPVERLNSLDPRLSDRMVPQEEPLGEMAERKREDWVRTVLLPAIH